MCRACAGLISAAFLYASAAAAAAAAPRLYSQPGYQAPVHAGPDDLLLLPGYGVSADDVVVYRSVADSTLVPNPPDSIPAVASAQEGTAEVVSAADAPYSLTLRLPRTLREDQTYALWAHTAAGAWSNGILINDARPLWLTPARVYARAASAGLPRVLKVVGRNLQPAPGRTTRVRLTGPQTFVLPAANDNDPGTAIERYAAAVDLPDTLPVGEYRVALSRDGVSWVALPRQTLTVRPDPPAAPRFPVGAYGCRADDDADDVRCITAAIAAAGAGGGGVEFGPGTWKLADGTVGAGIDFVDGILVPRGVDLLGAGTGTTVIERGQDWSLGSARAATVFTLQGGNTVSGITFRDATRYRPDDNPSMMLRLGKTHYRVDPRDPAAPATVSDVVITDNVFDRPYTAIGTGGLPIERLYVTRNEFGAYALGLDAGGDRYNVARRYHVDDAVIAYNVFKPGSYIDPAHGQGAIASVIGAARRLDFSHNLADGSAADYLDSPADAHGWRAAFFWHMNSNQEMLLVAQNTALCSGDKAGDGEAIAYDNNANTFAFDAARAVVQASADSVTVNGPLRTVQHGKDLGAAGADYYGEHWVQIAQGPGVGQVRRISGYRIDPASGRVTFTVTPAWDVAPEPGASRLTVARQFWQVYTVDNVSDQRTPPCRKANANGPKGGAIAVWAQTADAALEGNRLYDSGGIALQQAYSAAGNGCGAQPCAAWTSFLAFVEVRGNTIAGEYDWTSDCSLSGISAAHAASPTPSSPPPVAGYGVAIAYNTISRADGLRGGAISLPRSWYAGPPPGRWQVVNNTLIHHNAIVDLPNPPPARTCDVPQRGRIGIHIHDRLAWNTVLYANTCVATPVPLRDDGSRTVRVCPPGQRSDSCECPMPVTKPR